jgi:hypothetical protein
MINNYEVAEVVEMGRAQDVILGSTKDLQIYPDGTSQVFRDTLMEDE